MLMSYYCKVPLFLEFCPCPRSSSIDPCFLILFFLRLVHGGSRNHGQNHCPQLQGISNIVYSNTEIKVKLQGTWRFRFSKEPSIIIYQKIL